MPPETALRDIAFTLNSLDKPYTAHCCLTIVAESSQDLNSKLDAAVAALEDPERTAIQERQGIYILTSLWPVMGNSPFSCPAREPSMPAC